MRGVIAMASCIFYRKQDVLPAPAAASKWWVDSHRSLRAVMPDERTRTLLTMKRDEPCLLVIRRTWTAGQIASVARLYYPGSRYEMSGRFRP